MASRSGSVRGPNGRTVERPPRPARKLGVVLIDPLPVVRAGLGMLIEDGSDLEVVAEAGDADEALEALGRIHNRRIVVLVGLGITGERDAFWLIRTLRERFPALAILGCGANADPMAISRALFVGADGFVDKNVDPPSFLRAVRQASDGEMVLAGPPTEWIGTIAEGIEGRSESEHLLTEREREVLVVASEGLTAREIAERLGVSERTVTTHLGRIYGKLGVGTRVAAIRVAANAGIVGVGVAS